MYINVHAYTHTTQPRVLSAQNQSVSHRTAECRQEESHMCPHHHTYISPGRTYPAHGSKTTGPCLPVACTMHSWDVRGCTSGRRGLAGRILAGTDQNSSILWPPLGVVFWHPVHSHFCSEPAGKPGPLTKPPWSAIGYKGGHKGHYGEPLKVACGCHSQNCTPTLHLPSEFHFPLWIQQFLQNGRKEQVPNHGRDLGEDLSLLCADFKRPRWAEWPNQESGDWAWRH